VSAIGDKDPEDAYDAGDPPTVRLEVLERVVASLQVADDRRELRRQDALRVVDNNRRAPGVDRRRLERIRRELEAL
jgi:hypothetical protein